MTNKEVKEYIEECCDKCCGMPPKLVNNEIRCRYCANSIEVEVMNEQGLYMAIFRWNKMIRRNK